MALYKSIYLLTYLHSNRLVHVDLPLMNPCCAPDSKPLNQRHIAVINYSHRGIITIKHASFILVSCNYVSTSVNQGTNSITMRKSMMIKTFASVPGRRPSKRALILIIIRTRFDTVAIPPKCSVIPRYRYIIYCCWPKQ